MATRTAIGVVLMFLGSVPAVGGEERSDEDRLTLVRAALARIEKSWAASLERTAKQREVLEKVRAACRRSERSANPTKTDLMWKARWRATRPHRKEILRAMEVHGGVVTGGLSELGSVTKGQQESSREWRHVSERTVGILAGWIAIGEPKSVLELGLRSSHLIPHAFLSSADSRVRRAFLSLAVKRVVATPGKSDLDALCDCLAWESIFRRNLVPIKQLELVSRDLVVLFSERSENGVTKSSLAYYVPGRFRDRGFARRYRDDSDQVRHFAWAFRMFAMSKNRDLTARVLSEKEYADAQTRNRPVNRADLALNDAARRLVEWILAEPGSGVADWARKFRRELSSDDPEK